MTGAFITMVLICLALTSLAWALWRAYRTQVKEREDDQWCDVAGANRVH